jgi:hypothetical protein
MLLELDQRNKQGSIAILKLVAHVNEAELKWKAQEISNNGFCLVLVYQ